MESIYRQLPGVLLPWYKVHKRSLPWRESRDPYHIWLSEIMLQQTRVEAVRGYYARFLETLPSIESLANANDEVLYKLWEGLGYYSRVRNLKKAAMVIMQEHGGHFPEEHSKVLALPGVGPYTAGAVCSIAFGAKTPAVDGNVLRLISRLTADDTPIDLPAYKTQVQQYLANIYPEEAGNFTQALMELGATVCGPNRAPECNLCPCKEFCLGYRQGSPEKFPVKLPKKGRKTEDKTIFMIHFQGQYALLKRPEKGLLSGLWQFPEASGKLDTQQALEAAENLGFRISHIHRQVDKVHIFTHIQWNMRGYYLEASQPNPAYTWLTEEEIESTAALPTAFRQFWEDRL